MLLSGPSSPADALRSDNNLWNDLCFEFQWRSPRKKGYLWEINRCISLCYRIYKTDRRPVFNTPPMRTFPLCQTSGFPSVWYRFKCLYFLLLLTVNQGQLFIVEISLDTCNTKMIVVYIEKIFVFWLICI